jgi:hypothetical protein
MCWAGLKAQSLPKPGPFEPGQAQPKCGLQLGLGLAWKVREPKAQAWARAFHSERVPVCTKIEYTYNLDTIPLFAGDLKAPTWKRRLTHRMVISMVMSRS